MPMPHGDAETRILFFQLCDRGATPILRDENDAKPRFLKNDPTLRTQSSTPLSAKVTKFCGKFSAQSQPPM